MREQQGNRRLFGQKAQRATGNATRRVALRRCLGRVPIALAVAVLAGIALRIVMSAVYEPAILNLADSYVYLDMAANDLFSDPSRAIGYSIFLRGLHGVWADVDLVLFAQHLMGIATGLLLYATVRRIGAPVWAGVITAAAVMLSLDQIFLEHALMPETAFTLAISGVLYACVRALSEPAPLSGPLTTRMAWVIAAGALLGVSAWLRPVTVPLAPFLAVWLFFALSGAWRARLLAAVAAAATAGVVVLGYFALNESETGYFGFSQSSGWGLYSRTAPFAECTRFDPPAGTESLCETTPVDSRPGPDFYGWEAGSPARQLFGEQPNGDEQLSDFAREVITHQPLSYAEDVARDFARYFVTVDGPDFGGAGYEVVDVDRRALGFEEGIHAGITDYYADEPLSIKGGVTTLGDLQNVLSVRATLLLAALLLAIAGLVLGRGRVRAGVALLLGASLLAMLVPVVTAIYSARYAIPVSGPLVGAGAIGAWLIASPLLDALRVRRHPSDASGPPAF